MAWGVEQKTVDIPTCYTCKGGSHNKYKLRCQPAPLISPTINIEMAFLLLLVQAFFYPLFSWGYVVQPQHDPEQNLQDPQIPAVNHDSSHISERAKDPENHTTSHVIFNSRKCLAIFFRWNWKFKFWYLLFFGVVAVSPKMQWCFSGMYKLRQVSNWGYIVQPWSLQNLLESQILDVNHDS